MPAKIYELNEDWVKNEAQAAKERGDRQFGDYLWASLRDDHTTYFFICPPWSERGYFARVVWKHYNMPGKKSKGGRKRTRYTCWKTHDIYEPGMGENCPVCGAVDAIWQHDEDKAKDMNASPSAYVNAIIYGYRPADREDEFIAYEGENDQDRDNAHLPHILRLPRSVYDQIMQAISKPGIGRIDHPDRAVMVAVKKTGSGKFGTNYEFSLIGDNSDPAKGFVPKRQKIYDSDKELEEILEAITDLDEVWSLPSEKEKEFGESLAQRIRADVIGPSGVSPSGRSKNRKAPPPPASFPKNKSNGSGKKTPPPPPTGGSKPSKPSKPKPPSPPSKPKPPAVKSGSKSKSSEDDSSSKSDDDAESVPPERKEPPPAPAAEAEPEEPEPKAAEEPETEPEEPEEDEGVEEEAQAAAEDEEEPEPEGGLPATLWQEESDLPSPPQNPDKKGKPYCYQRYYHMQQGPNSGWCKTCTYQVPCKLSAPAVEEEPVPS